MANQEFRFDAGANILQPALEDYRNLLAPFKPGASLTVAKGQSLAVKTSDQKVYPFNPAATDGTQNWACFSQYAFSTDASGNAYLATGGGTGAPFFFSAPFQYINGWISGCFDPTDLATRPASGTPTAEVDTATPTNPTTGDIYSVEVPGGQIASFIVGATQTAAAVVTGLTNAWNANPYLKALATPSGSGTLILTATQKGLPLNLTVSAVGTGTFANVITTPAVAAVQKQVDTWTFGGTITTGDVYTVTATYGGGQTRAVSFTVGATQTAAAVDAGLIAAWNADPYLSQIAVASGTTTFILTGVNPGSTQNVTAATTGAGTVAKVSTAPALGIAITDILPSRPGAYVLSPYGFWVLP